MPNPNPVEPLLELIVALVACLQMISAAPMVTPGSLPAEGPTRCQVSVSADRGLEAWVDAAIAELAPALDNIDLHLIDRGGAVTIGFGGEWPVDRPQLGWTAPDRQTILINRQHPLSSRGVAMIDVIAHEFGHVLIGPKHVDDGTLLDPHIDGVIRLGDDDLQALSTLTCDDLPFV